MKLRKKALPILLVLGLLAPSASHTGFLFEACTQYAPLASKGLYFLPIMESARIAYVMWHWKLLKESTLPSAKRTTRVVGKGGIVDDPHVINFCTREIEKYEYNNPQLKLPPYIQLSYHRSQSFGYDWACRGDKEFAELRVPADFKKDYDAKQSFDKHIQALGSAYTHHVPDGACFSGDTNRFTRLNIEEKIARHRGVMHHEFTHLAHKDIVATRKAKLVIPALTSGMLLALDRWCSVPYDPITHWYVQEFLVATLSRYQERRADGGIPDEDLPAAKRLFESLHTKKSAGGPIARAVLNKMDPFLLLSHPSLPKRIEAIQKRLNKLEQVKQQKHGTSV